LIGLSHGFITILQITDVKLLSFPEELKIFSHLQELRLDNCQLDSIPDWIASFHFLKFLHLPRNQIQSCDFNFDKIFRLQYLDLRQNNLKFVDLPYCKRLNGLDVGENPIVEFSSSFWKLKNLRRLSVDHSKLASLPDKLMEIPRLNMMDLNNTLIEDLTCLHHFHWYELHLENLHLSKMPPLGHDVSQLGILSVARNRLIELPDFFSQMSGLWELNLSSNLFTEVPKIISSMPNLLRLNLSQNPFHDYIQVFLSKINCLKWEEQKPFPIRIAKMNLIPLYKYLKINSEFLPYLLAKIETNQPLDDIDIIHPKLYSNLVSIIEFCDKYPSETAKSLMKYLDSRTMKSFSPHLNLHL